MKMKKVGVWLDKNVAHVVTLKNNTASLHSISSNIEHYRPHGGSGTRLKGGPQDVVQDSKYLEREKHQLKQYFKNIISEIKDTDAMVIFGPAETKEKFNKEMQTNYYRLSTKIKGLKKADSMTNNQVIAWVKRFFKSS